MSQTLCDADDLVQRARLCPVGRPCREAGSQRPGISGVMLLRMRALARDPGAVRPALVWVPAPGDCAPQTRRSTTGFLLTAERSASAAIAALVGGTGTLPCADGPRAATDLNRHAAAIRAAGLPAAAVTLLAAGTARLRAMLALTRRGLVNRLIAGQAPVWALLALGG